METQVKQPVWVVPVLVVSLTAMTLIALVSWVSVVFGGFGPGISSGRMGGMNGGIMMNTANKSGAGNGAGGCGQTCDDPKKQGIQDSCVKKQQKQNTNQNTTL